MIEKLHQKGLLASTSISQLLSVIVYSSDNKECRYRVCAKCCYNEIEVVDTHGEENVTWYQWIRKSVSEEKKTYTHFVKEAKTGTLNELLKCFLHSFLLQIRCAQKKNTQSQNLLIHDTHSLLMQTGSTSVHSSDMAHLSPPF